VTFSEQATLQAQLDRVLTEIARVEWKLALEEMVQRWLGDDDSSTESPGRPAIDESLSDISCVRHSMTTRSIYADQQDEDEERGDRGEVRGVAEDTLRTA
jgi:hypothetical protein